MLGESNETLMVREEVQESVKEIKAGKTAELDGCAAECLKSYRVAVIGWLVRSLNVV